MSPVVATIIIGVATLLSFAMVWAAVALWRLGSKVGGFEAAVAAANAAATAAKAAADDAQAAAQRAAADAVAAARALYDAMAVTVRSFEEKLEGVRRELAEARGHWHESHDLVEKVNDHETRLSILERDHERNHDGSPALPFEQSARHYLPVPPAPAEDAAPLLPDAEADALFDAASEKHDKGGKR